LDAEVAKLASATAPGRMSASDKAKLDSATSAATASTLVQRDASGRFKAAAPAAADDVARKLEVDAHTAVIATIGAAGHVQLNSNTDSTSTTQAATPSAVKAAYDLASTAKSTADAAMPKTGGTFTGAVSANAGVYMPNNVAIVGIEPGGTGRPLVHINPANEAVFGSGVNKAVIYSNQNPKWTGGPFGVVDMVHTGGGQTIGGQLNVGRLSVVAQGGNEGGEIALAPPPVGSTLAGNVIVDILVAGGNDMIRFYEGGGSSRGAILNLTNCLPATGSEIFHSGNQPRTTVSSVTPTSARVGDVWIDTST